MQPLTREQIDLYLDNAGGQPMVRQAFRDDQELLEMCSNPFLLRLLIELANQGEANAAFALTGSIESRRKQLLDLYVKRKQDLPTVLPHSQQQMIRSLSWLARQMNIHHQATFYIERMQPSWFPDAHSQRYYRLLVNRFLVGITALLFSGLLACFRGDLIPHDPGLFYWLGGGRGDSVLGWMAPGIGGGAPGSASLSLLFSVVVILVQLLGDRRRIPTFTAKALRHALFVGLCWGLLIGGASGIVSGVIYSREAAFTCLGGMVSGLACGGSLGFLGGIIAGLQVFLIVFLRYDTRFLSKKEKKKVAFFSWKERVINGLLFGGCGFLGFVSIYAWQAGSINQLGIGYGLIAAVYFGLIYHRGVETGVAPEVGVTIHLAETIVWSWQEVRLHFKENLKKGALLAGILLICVVSLITCLSSLFYGVNYGIRYGLIYGVVVAMISGITGWLMGVLTSGWSNDILDEGQFSYPNEGIHRSGRNALFAACLFGPIGGLTCGFASAFAFALGGVSGWSVLGSGLAIILTLSCFYQIFTLYGGIALLEHYTLRWYLWRRRVFPWDSTAFCNYAVERAFLKKWGGGYRFIHTLLEEHFASYEEPR